ncbi:MAG: insulinase family protein [Planctomycetota bacterium]|nr:insulinase family protein [Planctomycetota bacterium]MDW8373864.1 insulinase family protein [Planctomycetota bacterium]
MRCVPVPALGLTALERTLPGGLVHWHLACSDEHRAACLAFRTPPADSTGLPHILEHLVLCGSQRYPVRDPFFLMLRRSLATFMNAITYADLTAYPFATQVARDWDHLFAVYLDAVFAPRLDRRDFWQEGHRLSPESDGSWKRQGVVFNEMQGALSDTDAQVNNALLRALLPDTVYRHESGGEPTEIPRLTHEALVAFHRRCYCPANALLVTYGDLELARIDAMLAPYLSEPGAALPPPAPQAPLASPQRLAVPVPIAEGQAVEDVTETGLCWVWGDTADIDEVLDAELIDRLLLGHAGAPLRLALERSRLGRGLGGSGYGSWWRNGLFTAAIDGHPLGAEERIEQLILDTLRGIVQEGIAEAEIAAALHQMELSHREVRGDRYPYGLTLCLRLLAPWNYGVDPLPFLDVTPALERLRARATASWVRVQCERRLLANPHHAAYRAVPDPAFHQRWAERVAELDRAELAEAGAADRLRAAAAALAARQAEVDDLSCLPCLDLAEVPRRRRWAEGQPVAADGIPRTVFQAATNGLSHLLVALPLAVDEDLDLVPLLCACLGALGCGARDYVAQSALLNACSGGLSAWVEWGGDPGDVARLQPWFCLEIKGLTRRATEYLPLLAETLLKTRFDELPRLRELIEQAVAAAQDRVMRQGNALAAQAAARGLPGAVGLAHRVAGLGRLSWLKQQAAAGDAAVAELAPRLAALRDRLAAVAPQAAVISDRGPDPELLSVARWPPRPAATLRPQLLPGRGPLPPTAYTIGTAVQHCALVFAAPPLADRDAAPLAVAARLLTHRWLHPRLRERGGAYGGSASYSSGLFQLTSYRDPRLEETYQDMREGLRWLAEAAADAQALHEAQLSVLQGLDAPGSPAGEARRRFLGDLTGRTPDLLDGFRARVLEVAHAELRAAVQRWLPPDGGCAACITAPERARRLGWAAEPV